MKNKICIISFSILFVLCQVIYGQEKGVGNRTVSKLPSKEKRWALIIGVSQYDDGNITMLPGANNDAKALRDALRDYAGFDEKQIILLTTDESKDRQPSKNNILRYLGNLSGAIPKDGLLLVAFSGHGIERQKQAFLLASDTPYNDNVRVLERTAISVSNDLKELVRDTGVGQVIILLDACRNDPSSGRSSSDNPLTRVYRDSFSFDIRNRDVEAFATLYATSIGERAYEYTRENKGYFTWAFIEGLKGGAVNEAGEITLGNLIRYIEKTVTHQVNIDLGGNKLQRPFSIIEGFKAEELVLGKSLKIAISTPVIPISIESGEIAYWKESEKLNTISGYENYLTQYPNGDFAKVAKFKLGFLKWVLFMPLAKTIRKYEYVKYFSEGLAPMKFQSKFGAIDKNGTEVIPPKYDSMDDFHGGYARVRLNGKSGIINSQGVEVIPLKYDLILGISDAFSVSLDRQVAAIDNTGSTIVPFGKYDEIWAFVDGFARVGKDEKFGFVDARGNLITPVKYDYVESFSEGLGPVFLKNKMGFVNKDGREVISLQFDRLYYYSPHTSRPGFSDGFAIVKSNGKYGYIDHTGRIAIPYKYDDAGSFSEGIANVKLNGKWGHIDRFGNAITNFKYDFAGEFNSGMASVDLNGKSGFVNTFGKEITGIKYDLNGGKRWVDYYLEGGTAELNGKLVLVDKTGKEIVSTKYQKIWSLAFSREGFFGVELSGKKGFVDVYGNEYFDF